MVPCDLRSHCQCFCAALLPPEPESQWNCFLELRPVQILPGSETVVYLEWTLRQNPHSSNYTNRATWQQHCKIEKNQFECFITLEIKAQNGEFFHLRQKYTHECEVLNIINDIQCYQLYQPNFLVKIQFLKLQSLKTCFHCVI